MGVWKYLPILLPIYIFASAYVFTYLNIDCLKYVFDTIIIFILPGYLLCNLLIENKSNLSEYLLLCFGMSLGINIISVFLANIVFSAQYMHHLFDYRIILPLLFVVNIFLGIANLILNRPLMINIHKLKISYLDVKIFALSFILIVVGILSIFILTNYDNNALTYFYFLTFFGILVYICMNANKINDGSYQIIIYLLAFSLFSLLLFRSEYILGHDVHYEYYLYKSTFNNGIWKIIEFITLDSCLSITIFPAIIQSLFNITYDQQFLKLVYVCISSFIPVGVYTVSKNYLPNHLSFLASVFVFIQTIYLNSAAMWRVNFALFFVILIVAIIFSEISFKSKTIFLLMSFITLTISHYSTTYIFLFTLIAAIIFAKAIKNIFKLDFSPKVKGTYLILFFIILVLWHAVVINYSFASGVNFVENTARITFDMFGYSQDISGSYSSDANLVSGKGLSNYSLLSQIQYALTIMTFLFISIGIFISFLNVIKSSKIYEKVCGRFIFIDEILDKGKNGINIIYEFLCFGMVAYMLMLISFTIPYISTHYEIQRIFQYCIMFLSPFFICGIYALTSNIFRREWLKNLFIILFVIIYSLFSLGPIYEIFGEHEKTWHLSNNNVAKENEFVYIEEFSSINWLKDNRKKEYDFSFFDNRMNSKLVSQGLFSIMEVKRVSHYDSLNGYVVLSHNNEINNKMAAGNIQREFKKRGQIERLNNKIYTNYGSTIYL